MLRRRVHLSTICLCTVALFDLVTSLYLLSRGFGEANPLFRYLASYGSFAFAAGKLLFVGLPILILEYVRSKKPYTAEVGTWVAFGAYMALYCYSVLAQIRR